MSEKTILSVVPWIYDFAAYDLWIQPLGLLRLSTELKKLGFFVDFINCLDRYDPELLDHLGRKRPAQEQKFGCGRFYKEEVEKPDIIRNIPRHYFRYGIPVDLFRRKLAALSQPPDIVLMAQTMTYWYPGTQLAVAILKEIYPDVPVILGGVYPILMPDHARQATGADHIFSSSNFDEALTFILRILQKESLKTKRYELQNISRIDYTFLNDRRSIILETSKGCPYRCHYCSQHLISRQCERLSPEHVMGDIRNYLEHYDPRYFVFYDDALAYRKSEYFVPLLKKILALSVSGLSFHLPNGISIRDIDDELADLLMACCFKTLRLSLETADSLRQAATGGKVKNEDFVRAVNSLRKSGFKPWEIEVYMMIGLPGQRFSEVREGVDYVFSKGAVPVLTSYAPTPGSFFYETLFQDRMTDPLMHNNSIFSLKTPDMDEEMVHVFRREIKRRKGEMYPESQR